MRNDFLGDSLDMAKRSFLSIAAKEDLRVAVYPLPSNDELDFEMYKKMLNFDRKLSPVVMQHPTLSFWKKERAGHLRWIRDEQASFDVILLDPDKGVRRTLKKHNNMYVTLGEILDLVRAKPDTIFGVYHHKNSGGIGYQMLVNLLAKNCSSLAYDFGAACVLVVSKNGRKLDLLKSMLQKSLNPRRIITPEEL